MDQAADIASSNTGRGRRNGAEAYRTCRFIAALVVVMFLCLSTTWAQQPATVTIRGMVQDASGNPVNGASIRFERDGAPPAEITTNAEGAFAFPATAPGSYSVRAEKSGRRSRTLTVNAEQSKGEQLTLILKDGDDSKTSASSQPGAMEFADAPNFTIAAVTDWTAAGGHGSDAVLRTSESLTSRNAQLEAGARARAIPPSEPLNGRHSRALFARRLRKPPATSQRIMRLASSIFRPNNSLMQCHRSNPPTGSIQKITITSLIWQGR